MMGFGPPRLGERGAGALHTKAAFSEGTEAHPACKGARAPVQLTRELARAAGCQTVAAAWRNASLQPWLIWHGGRSGGDRQSQPLSPRTAQTQRRNRNTLPST